MIWILVAIGYVALAGYILWQAWLLNQYRQALKELELPF